ncbi:MAG: right-handed parallel beta-helix repeat-containing protein [Candidatus Zixiibacteriota bacterium]
MRLLVRIVVLAVFLFPLIVGATIINIPDDYDTIQEGINASSDGDTVLVQPNVYYENINFNGHNVVLASLFLTTGDTIYVLNTVIDGDRAGSVITFESGEDSTAQVVGFTIQNGYGHGAYPYFCGGAITCWDDSNPTIMNNTITSNRAFWCGGGISCCYSSPTIALNTIRGNEGIDAGGGIFCISSDPVIRENNIDGNWGYDGGAMYCYERSNPTITKNSIVRNSCASNGGGIFCADSSDPVIESNIITENYGGTFPGVGGGIFLDRSQPAIRNNLISRNVALYGGGLACTWSSNPQVLNNTFYGNVAAGPAPDYGYGGGLFCVDGSYPVITNSVFWADTAETEGKELYVDLSSFPLVTYCDIEDTLWPGAGNISVDPFFRDPANGDFHVQSITNPDCGGPADSPCIDAGDSSFVDSLISCDWGLGTLRSDMGAYGGGDSAQVGIFHQEDYVPGHFSMSQNYPNPFNAATVISYQLPTNNCVRLEICNLLGQRIATLVDSKQQTGYRSVVWDASEVSSGLYFYKLTTGDLSETKRMILVK